MGTSGCVFRGFEYIEVMNLFVRVRLISLYLPLCLLLLIIYFETKSSDIL